MEVLQFTILALDQATIRTGWSLWEDKNLENYGVLEVNVKEKNYIDRMQEMYLLIKKLVCDVQPDYVVLEGVQFQNSQKTYNQLSQMQGVIFSLLFEINIGFCLIEPNSWKKFCKIQGRKRAEQKISTIQMVKEKYNLDVSEDAADSIGIGFWAVNNLKKSEVN